MGTTLNTNESLKFLAPTFFDIKKSSTPCITKLAPVYPGCTQAVRIIALRLEIAYSVELKFVIINISMLILSLTMISLPIPCHCFSKRNLPNHVSILRDTNFF